MNKLPLIGTVELVSLPDDQIHGVPAKIDTGADSSAVWVSRIVEQDNTLSFTLFDKSSPFYTGKVITTRNYEVISVKNSFGKSELRYKIDLKLTLGGRNIKARFTLANRKNNKYPILIGRRTIQGKFLVDASRKPARRPFEVLVLGNKRHGVTEKFAKGLAQQSPNLHVSCQTYEDLIFSVGRDSQIVIRKGQRDLTSFDMVHFKTKTRAIAAVVAVYLDKRQVPFVDQAVRHLPKPHKLYQSLVMADNRIPVPPVVFILPPYLEKSFNFIKRELGLPFILKDINGRRGRHSYVISNERSFQKACRTAAADEVICMAQAFVPNDHDYRVLVFGNKIALVIKRDGKASLVPIESLPPKVQKMCLSAAQLFERQVAGVDIVQDKNTKLWYCLEVNDGPQLATGKFAPEKQAAFAAYLERKLAR